MRPHSVILDGMFRSIIRGVTFNASAFSVMLQRNILYRHPVSVHFIQDNE